MVGTVGAFVIGLGFYQFYETFAANFRKRLNLTGLSHTEEKWVMAISRFGLAARGIVFCVIGFFLIQAARSNQAGEARSLGEALQTLAQQPYGSLILGIVALGLVAYGIYMLIQARYSRIATH